MAARRPTGGRSTVRAAATFWKTAVVVATPLLALAVPLYVRGQAGDLVQADQLPQNNDVPQMSQNAAWCAYCIIIMAVYWMTEAIPIQATALLPVLLFPLFGVLTTKVVCKEYMSSSNILFMGGLMVAAAVEHCGLHFRIALRVLIWMGSSLKWLMLGFMAVTMFLSMWISNTATTAMMTPIIRSIITILTADEPEENEKPVAENSASERSQEALQTEEVEEARSSSGVDRKRLSTALYISVAYAANCGGTGTLTGTSPNLVLMGQLNQLFGPDHGLTYATFMMFGVPAMLICTLLAWLWIILLFLGPGQFRCGSSDGGRFASVRRALRRRYSDLGPITFHEKMVAALFGVMAVLWFLREPRFMPGWMQLFPIRIADATPAMLIVILMFVIPARPNFAFWSAERRDQVEVSEGLLTWKAVHEKVSWGVLILLGGGFAMAHAAKVSGLSEWVGGQLTFAFSLPPVALIFIVCLFTAMVTEVSSNTATATILLPVLGSVARTAGVNPLYLMLPVALTCSYAFMLPVATPPNAIVHQAGRLNTWDMIRAGIVMNVLCVAVITLLTNTLGVAIFDLHTFPAWANGTAAGGAE